MIGYPEHVTIVEVGPRDGLQNEKSFIPSAAKIAFIGALRASGLSQIETTSFVSPRWVPQLADAAEIARAFPSDEHCTYSVLVPNQKGLERALECGVRRIAVFTAASETFSHKNTNRSIAESLRDFAPIISQAREAGATVRGYVSTVFVCPYEGDIHPDKVLEVSEALLSLGVDEVSLGDTVGRAAPREVEHCLNRLLAAVPAARLALHLHDTCETALANVVIGLQMGITTYDTSAGGLGGCPYAPGASGNLATEKLVYMLDRMGIASGVDREAVAAAARELRRSL